MSDQAKDIITPDIATFKFSWIDYSIFSSILIVSLIIGIYYAYKGRKQNTISDYMMGGRNMSVIPIAASLVSSLLSGMSLISVPADVYLFGASFWLTAFSALIAAPTLYYIFVPVYHSLQVMSIFEYLHFRFGTEVRTVLSFCKILAVFIKMPIVIYVPALAFNQVSGLNIYLIASGVCMICTFYTMLGGLRAVVWTDTLQFLMMLGSMLTTLLIAVQSAGGIEEVFRIASKGGRTNILDFDLDPTKRTSFWTVLTGMYFTILGFTAADPSVIQKINSLPSYSKIWKAILLFALGIATVETLSSLTGLSLYAVYHDCDPLLSGKIVKNDQIVIHFLMEVASYTIAVPGIFIAGIFSGCLSTVSTFLNMISFMVYSDFIQPFLPENSSEQRANNIMKFIVMVTGVLATAAVALVDCVPNILPINFSIGGAINGPILAAFSLGILVPFANKQGVLSGVTSSVCFMMVMALGSQYYATKKVNGRLPLSVEACNTTIINNTYDEDYPAIPLFYQISFFYYTLLGFFIAMIVGMVVSLLTGGLKQKIDRRLLSPVVHWMLPKEDKFSYKYSNVEKVKPVTINA